MTNIKTSATLIVMPHDRSRFMEPFFTSLLKWSPVVGIFGLRQVGKTTLVKNLTQAFNGDFVSFDQDTFIETAREKPVEFLSRKKLLTLDEVQKVPELFPIIKDLVGTQRKPGRFLLTGSVRFTLKKEVKESLTGRIVTKELLPFSIAEALQIKKSVFLASAFRFLSKLTDNQNSHSLLDQMMKTLRHTSSAHLSRQLIAGGLPIPCFSRDVQKRTIWFESYFETLITRDIVMVDKTLSAVGLRRGLSFLRELALAQGDEINLANMAAKSSLTRLMATRLMKALENLALIDLILPETRAKKVIKKMQVEWKDSGLWSYLIGSPQLNNIKETQLLLTQEYRSQLEDFNEATYWNFYRNRDGANIPWILRKGKMTLAIKHFPLENPRPYDWRILRAFTQENKNSLGLLLGPEKATPTVLDKHVWFIPVNWVF